MSAINQSGVIDVSVVTQSDLSALQYRAVKKDSDGYLVACGANEQPLGILQNAPDGSSGDDVGVVRVQGLSRLYVAEAADFGEFLTADADSKGEVVDAADEQIIAKSMETAAGAGLIEVLVWHGKAHTSDAS